MCFANAVTFCLRHGREMSSCEGSFSRRFPLDFQCPVSLSSLSEELLEEGLALFFLLRLRFLPSDSESEGLLSGVTLLPILSWTPLFPEWELAPGERLCPILSWIPLYPEWELAPGERLSPSLSWILRSPSLVWTLPRLSL